ncbi:MAG: glycosyltransferase [Gemmatimonadota bacterium]
MDQRKRVRGIGELPHLTVNQERLVRVLGVVSLLFGVYWLHWRWTETINPDALVFSLLLVSAETWGWVGSALFMFNAWRIPQRASPPAPPGRIVDVFITAYDEPLEVLRRTANGACAIRYPHRTYFLDDGKRDELRQIAQDLGIGYIRRTNNANAKAGNLNFALSVTSGEFILQLDSDHVPLPNIIHQLLGYFTDERVAFVQTPQDFYNTDSFTHVVNDHSRSLWEENRIFYSLLQPGKDHWNASFFCGSGGMLRRAALESIGGFSTNTIIEDMETSLKLHSNGWKSVFHPEALAFGLSPSSAGAFHVQRMRWAQGSMQILKKMNPLFLPGLSTGQRICYLAANLYPLDGLQKAIFYLTPVIFLFTGMVPIAADGKELMLRLLPYLVLSITAFELLARGTGFLFISERYNMAKFFTYIVALAAYFTNGKLKFNVTPKGVTDVPFRTFAAPLFILVVSLAGVLWAPLARRFGWVDYQTRDFDLAFFASAMWVVWNVYFAAVVVRMSLRMRQQRSDHRFLDSLPVRIRVVGATEVPLLALTQDLNPLGIAFRSTRSFAPDTELEIDLPLSTRPVTAIGRVVHTECSETTHGTVYLHGVHFSGMSLEDRDTVEVHCMHHSVPIWRKRYRQSLDFFSKATEVMGNSRGVRRQLVQLPAHLRIRGETQSDLRAALLEEITVFGARILVENPIPEGTTVDFKVPGTKLAGSGTVVFSRPLELPMSVRFVVGLKLANATQALRPDPRVAQPLASS